MTIALHDEKLVLEEGSCPRDYASEGYDKIAVSGISCVFEDGKLKIYFSQDSDDSSWSIVYDGSYTIWSSSE